MLKLQRLMKTDLKVICAPSGAAHRQETVGSPPDASVSAYADSTLPWSQFERSQSLTGLPQLSALHVKGLHLNTFHTVRTSEPLRWCRSNAWNRLSPRTGVLSSWFSSRQHHPAASLGQLLSSTHPRLPKPQQYSPRITSGGR